MDNSAASSVTSGEPIAPRSHRLVRRLALLYGVCAIGLVALLLAAWLPAGVAPPLRALAHELSTSGLAGASLSALLLSLTSLLATLVLTAARTHQASVASNAPATRWRALIEHPGAAARVGQALIIPVGAVLMYVAVRVLWPSTAATEDETSANIAAGFVFGITFASLVAERIMAVFPEPQLPEAPTLRRTLLLTTVLLAASASIELAHGAGLEWVRWPKYFVAILPIVAALELAIRALARLFLPNPPAATAKAVTDSIVVGLVTGGPRSPGTLLKTHLGLDFARSWALSFLSSAILPAILGTALLCWGLTGLKLIDLGQRGIYERFGAPVRVLDPGLHLILPWPLGRLRPVEFGSLHSVAIGVDQNAATPADQVGAEDAPPLSLNRLWESTHAGQANYLVASLGTGQQGFQSVSTEISVLYRVGLTDSAAMDYVYSVADPESLIREAGSRMVLRYFNSRTLEEVLGASRENVAAAMREELAADLQAHRAGVEVVSVLIEEIHPPAGAATAYHAVQAAQINASASIADERGRASRAAGVAQQEAHQLTASADATAAERLDAADADSYRFGAERRAHAEGGQSFLLERTFAKLQAALSQKSLVIVDHRLNPAQAPILDLRSPVSGSTAGDGTDFLSELGGRTATPSPQQRAPRAAAPASTQPN